MFKITAAHRELWLLKKAPAFIRQSMIPEKPTRYTRQFNINDCIPEPGKPSFEHRSRSYRSNIYPLKRTKYDLHNTLHVLGLMRRNGEDLAEGLNRLANDKQSTIRQVFAKRWLKRIEENRKKNIIDYQI